MVCKKCGAELPETALFCGSCGVSVADEEKEEVAREEKEEASQAEEKASKEEEKEANEAVKEEKTEKPSISEVFSRIPSGCECESDDCPFCTTKADEKPEPPARGFGVAAIVVCLVLVFFTSIACGVFAGLYFSEKNNHAHCLSVQDTERW